MEERKHLFNSTEKSDFILNMTEPQFQKMGFIYLVLAAVVPFVLNIPYYVSKGGTLFTYNSINVLQTMKYVDNAFVSSVCSGYISYLQIGVYAMSFIGFLILLVSATKKYFKPGENKLFILPVIFLLFVVIATFTAYSIEDAFFGRDYRYTGMLTLFSYVALFMAASQINARDRRKTYLDVFMAISLVNAVYGILQIIPSLITTVPNFFYDLLYINGDAENSYEYFIADGLVQSPHALAALMTMAMAVGTAGFAYESKASRKLIYGLCCIPFAAAGFATCTVAGYIGVPFAVFAVLVIELIRLISKHGKKTKGLLAKPVVCTILTALFTVGVFAVMSYFDKAHLYDDSIIWTDGTIRMGACFPLTDKGTSWHIYPKIWRECLNMLKTCWVFGTGPDCIGYSYYGTTNLYSGSLGFSVDRSYNEYFDIALTCGIPCLLMYLSIGFVTIKKGIKCVGNFFKQEDSWTAVAIFVAVLAYGLQANVNISIITVTPYFFIFAGLVWNKPHTADAPKAKSGRKLKK